MAINRVSFSAEALTSNTDITLELLPDRPDVNAYLATPVTPNRMVGFLSPQGYVELFITDSEGRRYVKVK